MKFFNAAGREVVTEFNNVKHTAYTGAKKYIYNSKVKTLEEALKKSGIKDGMTVSFHHQLRNGDYVLNMTLDAIRNLGVKNIRLAQTAMFNIHEPVIQHIKDGTVNRIEGSINGVVGDYISKNPLEYPVVLRSHGGRWGAVKSGELKIDICILAASTADEQGDCTGLIGKSAFGPICFSQIDVMHADKTIVITDNLVDRPCEIQEIEGGFVDHVVAVEDIGNPEKIVSGSLKHTDDPVKLKIAKESIDLIDAAGLIKDKLLFQAGAGGMSLAAIKYLDERLTDKDCYAIGETGGVTEYIVNMFKVGHLKSIYGLQCFDTVAVEFLAKHRKLMTNIGHYADPFSKSRFIDGIHATILGATEVDVDFNVNVNTHSDGRMLHGIGGHQDSAAGAYLTIITVPLFRKNIPVIRDRVTTISTPGVVVDAIVTDQGIAINPKRQDIIDKVKGKVNLVPIEQLKEIAYQQTGGPPEVEFGEKIAGMTKWFDGSLLDMIYQIKE